jgi:uncharacterized protein YcfJ
MRKTTFTAISLSAGLVAALFAPVVSAEEMGRVLSSTPVVQQVGVPRQVCSNEPVLMQGPKTGAGAVIGAIAGGAMGNAVGNGSGRAAATILGLVGGALIGDRVEGGGQPQVQQVQQCSTQTFYENRTVAFNVVYEYAGKQYSVQMPSDPGPYVRLQITPVGTAPPPPAPMVSNSYVQPMVSETMYVDQPPVYPVYQPRPYYRNYAPIGLNFSFGYVHHGGGRGHWR